MLFTGLWNETTRQFGAPRARLLLAHSGSVSHTAKGLLSPGRQLTELELHKRQPGLGSFSKGDSNMKPAEEARQSTDAAVWSKEDGQR